MANQETPRFLKKYNLYLLFSLVTFVLIFTLIINQFLIIPYLEIRLNSSEINTVVFPILVILLLFGFILWPIAFMVETEKVELKNSEEDSRLLSIEINKLYRELSKSYQDLEAVQLKPPPVEVIGHIDFEGNIYNAKAGGEIFLGKHDNLKSLLLTNDYSKDFVSGVFEILNKNKNWSGEIQITDEDGDFCWYQIQLVPIYNGHKVKVLGQNITEVKEAKQLSREINAERINKLVKEQRYRSALILEGQEEERKRISKELHDSIGQMLTALKLSVESISPSNSISTKKRLEDTKFLLRRLILEIRRVSFNMAPPSLAEFGLVAALKKLCSEMTRLTQLNISFENKTKFIKRLESNIENNIYRIIQEALNNACKYASPTHIKVTFEHTQHKLNISIEDDGRGFDFSKLDAEGRLDKSGHGIFNMRERAAFIDSAIIIDSVVGCGTKISLILNLEKEKV